MLKRALIPSLCAVLLACGSPTVSPPVMLRTPKPGFVESERRVKLDLSVTGAQNVALKDYAAELLFVEIHGDPNPRATWFFSVSAIPGRWVTAKDGRYLLFTADLSPGLYEGPGTYRLSPRESGTNVGGASGPASASYIALLTPPPNAAEVRFDKLDEPCTIKIGEDYGDGTVTCPKLSGPTGSVSARWTWTLT